MTLDLIKSVNQSSLSQGDKLKVVRILAAFKEMDTALQVGHEILNTRYTRFDALDQNPLAVRDLIGAAALRAVRVR